MKIKKIIDFGLNIFIAVMIVYLAVTGKYMLYIGIVKSWFSSEEIKQEIKWYSSYRVAILDAVETEKNILILFTAPQWCMPCKAMEQTTLQNSKLAAKLNADFIPVRILDTSVEISEFEIKKFPTLVLISPEGDELKRKSGFIGVSEFISFLDK